jgi:hypothetical protein
VLIALVLAAGGLSLGLRPLEHYSGHCWSASLSNDAVDRHCFTAVFGGKHLRDRHIVTSGGRPVYSGETIYSVEAGRVVFTYWNSLGGIGRGELAVRGEDLVFSLVMRGTPDAAPQKVDSVWRRTSLGYDVVTGGDIRHFVRDDRSSR